MIERKTWEEFRSNGLLWWVNRLIHLCGWAIVFEVQEDGRVTDAYPARVKFRGFDEKSETEGFIALTKHLADNAKALTSEASE
jgi:hypothetical protein